jgi:hypothetical protein
MLKTLASLQIFFLTTWCLSVSNAWATSAIEVSFTDLVNQADVIAVGTVTDIREHWDAEKKAPFTLVTFSNLTVVKGSPGTSFTLEFLGGTMPDGLVMVIPGVPKFTVGEKALVFCAGNRRDFCPLVGVWQGVLRVMTDPQRKIETVSDNFRVPIIAVEDGKFVKRSPATMTRPPLPLSTLLQTIQQALSSGNH